jgi:hypothetical protein
MMHIIKFPVGSFGFVGSVPAPLAFSNLDEDLLEIAAQCGPGFAAAKAKRSGREFKSLSWPSVAEAEAAALAWAGSPEELAKHYRGAV